jgi:hypothetical protein
MSSSPFALTNAHNFDIVQPKAMGISLESMNNSAKKVKTGKGKGAKTTKAVSYVRAVAVVKTKKAQKPKAAFSRSGLTGGSAKVAKTILTLTQGNQSYRPDLTSAALGRATAAVRAAARSGLASKWAKPLRRSEKKKAASA